MVDRFVSKLIELPPADAPLARADPIFYDLDHSGESFEARIFFNNTRVSHDVLAFSKVRLAVYA